MKNLTKREQEFISEFLNDNGCGAATSIELLEDNFSCQCLEDLQEVFPKLSKNQIGGFLSSLQQKDVLWVDERDGDYCKSKSRVKQMTFEPNLYWVNDSFLEELNPIWKFNTKYEEA